jgi:hypothetical protein
MYSPARSRCLCEASATVNTLFAGIQILMPGETAQAHRRTAAAFRFIIAGNGAYTTASLRVHAVEHCPQASDGARVGVADYRFGVGGEGQLDASTVLWVRRAAHQPSVDQPIDHRGGGRRSGTQGLGQIGEGDRCQRHLADGDAKCPRRYTGSRPDAGTAVVKLQAVQHPGAVIKVEDGTSQHVAVAIDNAPGALPGGQQRLPPVEETQRSALKPARCMVTGNGITPPAATLRTGHGYRCSERLLTLPGADK